jgi:hypothetical protein
MGWGFGMWVTGYKAQFLDKNQDTYYFTGVFDFIKYLNDPFE